MVSVRAGSVVCSAFALLVGAAAFGFPGTASAADVTVIVDEAKLVKLPERVATIVIGNPLIADASIQSGGQLVITGKGYGLTNIIALDRSGTSLMDKSVQVVGPRGVVVVYRGAERETYSCTPKCERQITLGDGNTYFDSIITETGARNGMAQGNAPAAK